MQKIMLTSIQSAFKEIKHFCPEEWEGDYITAARDAIKRILQTRMVEYRDTRLAELLSQDVEDRCNGFYPRHLLTEVGDIELLVPRTRTFSAADIFTQFARRSTNVDRMILLSFVLGLSTRKVSLALLPVLGEPVSPQTVSRVASQLDEAVATYHKRSLSDKYQVLLFDGIVIKRKSGAGAQKRTILVAFGIRKDGKKEIIDFKQVQGESQSAWEGFLSDLYKRGLTGESLKKADRETVKKTLHKITHAKNLKEAKQAAQRFVKKWEGQYPKATKCLNKDLIDLLTFFTIKEI